MKILLVTDGKYPEYVNGVSIYVRYFAEEMVKKGHDIHVFHHIRSGLLKRPKIIRSLENGINYYGLNNSPISFSEALVHPLKSCHEKITAMIFSQILEEVCPEIVHFHEFQRNPSCCIDIVKAKEIPTVITLHDYWLICPRLLLFTLSEKICNGPDSGKNCVVHCISDDYLTRQYRKITMLLPDGLLIQGIKKIRNLYKKCKGERLGQSFSLTTVKKKHLTAKDNALIKMFKRREECLRTSLSNADLVLSVSKAVKKIFEKHGIEKEKIIVNQLGVKSVEWLKKKERRFKRYPIRFGFLGHLGPIKGAQLIVKAAQAISPNKGTFLFYGSANKEDISDFKDNTKELTHCQYIGRYDYRWLEDVFNSFDILIIPSICQETLGMIGLEAQAAGMPVIASNIGGMTDYIHNNINGLTFETGNTGQLSLVIQSIIDNPGLIEKFSKQAITPKTIAENSLEIFDYYLQVRRGGLK
ncbi:MAG: glycosyltransferase [bacterium]